ncbi:MAG TPA: hypothetical protein VMF31_12030 [Solirubrobacterales bacterium]|nr:hypothetical protein [Solirubrobacterales bacterium]
MLILLGVSTAMAVIAPGQRDRDPKEETASATGPTGATGETGASGPGGAGDPDEPDPNLAVETVKATGEKGTPPVATAEAAGRLVLTVETGGPADVSIPGLGRTAAATKYAPAVFDLILPSEAGSFKVVDADSGDTIAEIKTKG